MLKPFHHLGSIPASLIQSFEGFDNCVKDGVYSDSVQIIVMQFQSFWFNSFEGLAIRLKTVPILNKFESHSTHVAHIHLMFRMVPFLDQFQTS